MYVGWFIFSSRLVFRPCHEQGTSLVSIAYMLLTCAQSAYRGCGYGSIPNQHRLTPARSRVSPNDDVRTTHPNYPSISTIVTKGTQLPSRCYQNIRTAGRSRHCGTGPRQISEADMACNGDMTRASSQLGLYGLTWRLPTLPDTLERFVGCIEDGSGPAKTEDTTPRILAGTHGHSCPSQTVGCRSSVPVEAMAMPRQGARSDLLARVHAPSHVVLVSSRSRSVNLTVAGSLPAADAAEVRSSSAADTVALDQFLLCTASKSHSPTGLE
jgi:hypothetical protein